MKKFSEYIVEARYNKETLEKLEKGILKLDPKKYIRKAKEASKDPWYWSKRPNFLRWADQNNEGGGSYVVGSDYDLFRNYTYSKASKEVQKHIDKALPMKKIKNFAYNKTWAFNQDGEDHVFSANFKLKEFPKYFVNKFNRVTQQEIVKNLEKVFDFKIDGKGAFSLNTYRNRKGITPELVIPKKELIKDIVSHFQDIWKDANEDVSLRETMALVLSDVVIGNEFTVDNKEIVEKIKSELEEAKSVKGFRKVLNSYGFKNIPGDDILKELMKTKDFEYSTSGPDGYGHSKGIMYKINFETRDIIKTAWSSDD